MWTMDVRVTVLMCCYLSLTVENKVVSRRKTGQSNYCGQLIYITVVSQRGQYTYNYCGQSNTVYHCGHYQITVVSQILCPISPDHSGHYINNRGFALE